MKIKKIAASVFIILLLCVCGCTKSTDWMVREYPITEGEVCVPVLMYHHFTKEAATPGSTVVSEKVFEQQIAALKDAGYTAVTAHQLEAFIDKKAGLPEKPIIITMDDGYASNLEIAAPILEKYEMNATIYVIGRFVGQDINPHTGEPFGLAKFSFEQAKEWTEKGVIAIQSHTYDMHLSTIDGESVRDGVLMKAGEDDARYENALKEDIKLAAEPIRKEMGTRLCSLAFPYGFYNDTASEVFASEGARILMTTQYGTNYVSQNPGMEYIYMNRVNVGEQMSGDMLIGILKGLEK